MEGPGPVIVFRGMVSGWKRGFRIQSHPIQGIPDVVVDIDVDVVLPEPVRPEQPHRESWCGVVGVRILQEGEIFDELDLAGREMGRLLLEVNMCSRKSCDI